MKFKGADLIRFFQEWPPGEGVYHEDTGLCEDENGVLYTTDDDFTCGERVDPTKTYTLNAGFLGWQGEGDPPPDFEENFVKAVQRWVKARKATTLILEVPNERVEEVREYCAQMKIKVWK